MAQSGLFGEVVNEPPRRPEGWGEAAWHLHLAALTATDYTAMDPQALYLRAQRACDRTVRRPVGPFSAVVASEAARELVRAGASRYDIKIQPPPSSKDGDPLL